MLRYLHHAHGDNLPHTPRQLWWSAAGQRRLPHRHQHRHLLPHWRQQRSGVRHSGGHRQEQRGADHRVRQGTDVGLYGMHPYPDQSSRIGSSCNRTVVLAASCAPYARAVMLLSTPPSVVPRDAVCVRQGTDSMTVRHVPVPNAKLRERGTTLCRSWQSKPNQFLACGSRQTANCARTHLHERKRRSHHVGLPFLVINPRSLAILSTYCAGDPTHAWHLVCPGPVVGGPGYQG